MRKIILISVCFLSITSIFAQKTLNIHKENLPVETFPTSSIDSITFSEDETVMHIYTIEQSLDFPLSDVDSITINIGSDPSQTDIYLWAVGNRPATTSYQTVANSSNPDGPDFRPYMTYYPVGEGVDVKGAVLICPGGAFQFRSPGEGAPVARALSELGYQSFVVNYRLRPYTQQEGALDLARAVRFVRFHADYYGIEEEDIAVIGFSAGGILCGEMLLNFKGTDNGTALDPQYSPDQLDMISADAGAIGHIYSFYGRLSVGSTDVDLFRRSNLPPAFYCWGTNDGFAGQFAANANAVEQAGISVTRHILQGWPHGYGSGGNWIPVFDSWLMNIFDN